MSQENLQTMIMQNFWGLKEMYYGIVQVVNGIVSSGPPFELCCLVVISDSSNEGQFAFTVENIVMSQKLRGTLTYVIKVLVANLVAVSYFVYVWT